MDTPEIEEAVSIDSMMAWFKERIESRQPVPPSLYLDAAAKAIVLLQDLDEELTAAEMEVHRTKAKLIETLTASSAKELVKATDAYGTYLTLKAKKERVLGFIQVAKKRTEIIV